VVNQAVEGVIQLPAAEALITRRPAALPMIGGQDHAAGKDAAPLRRRSVGYDDLKDFTWLFKPHYEWIAEAATKSNQRAQYATSN